jgi:hypothetical protein
MTKTVKNGKCHLCHNTKDLQNSHIISKSLGKSIKKNHSKVYTLHDGIYAEKFGQDTLKEYMLCWDCEQKFNVFETYFSNSFSWSEYDERLYKFILSIFWRQIEWVINFSTHRSSEEMEIYKTIFINREQMRCFLDGGTNLKNKPLVYMFKIEDGAGYNFNVHVLTYDSQLGKKVSVFVKHKDGIPSNLLIMKPHYDDCIHFYMTCAVEIGFSIANICKYKEVEFYAIVSGGIVFLIQNDGVEIPDCPASSIIHCDNGKWKKNPLPPAVNILLNSYGSGVNYEASEVVSRIFRTFCSSQSVSGLALP